MNNELIDRHLDAILRASGSALRNYSMQKTIDDMRSALMAAINDSALTQQQEAEPVAWVDEEGRVVRVSEDGSGDGGWVSGHDRAIPDSWTPLHPPKPAAQPTMDDAIAAGNGTLHGAIDYWQQRALKAEAAQPQVPDGIAEKYNELLYHVARKFPNEPRHETALRYIKNAESGEAAQAAKEEGK